MNTPRKLMSIALVISMMCASFAFISVNVSSLDVGGDVVTVLSDLPNGVTVNDVVWKHDSSIALAVGSNESGGSNAFWYYPNTDDWVGITPYCVPVASELVYGPQDALEVGPWNLANWPVYNYTFYQEEMGIYSKLTEELDYTFNPVLGEITMLIPMSVGSNLWCWYNYSAREFFGVDYDKFTNSFGIVGNGVAGQSSALYILPGDSQMYEISHNGSWPTGTLYDIRVDEYGNFMAVGPLDLALFFSLADDAWYQVSDFDDSGWNYYTVGYELESHRYYLAGGNGAHGIAAYTDPLPDSNTIPGSHYNYDLVANFTGINDIMSIEWNNDPDRNGGFNYALMVGGTGLNVIGPIDYGASINGAVLSGVTLSDVAFDETTWAEASIVGWDSTSSFGYIFQFEAPGGQLLTLHTDNSQKFYCVDYRPPSSPGFGFVVGDSGGVKININAFDMSTRLYVNTDVPHMFNIGFWDASDVSQTSLLNTQVDVQNTYTFYTEVNYTVGIQDRFWDSLGDVNVILWAWYDEGQTGASSNPEDTWATVDNRTRQFSVTWNEGISAVPAQGVASMQYPIGSAGEDEFLLDSWWVDPNGYGADGKTWHLYFNVTFNNQTWAADGNGFGNGAATDIHDAGQSLNDINSWDFRFQIYDQNFVTALNESYEEFGIFKYTNISVLGNPVGNAPPGTNDTGLSPFSAISYAANVDYYINVSITDLARQGGGGTIAANNIRVELNNTQANNTNTQLNDTFSYIPGAAIPLGVWGNVSQPVANWMLPAPRNGTSANGPFGSDYNSLGGTSDLEWFATVPAATPEGTYVATITIVIGYYP